MAESEEQGFYSPFRKEKGEKTEAYLKRMLQLLTKTNESDVRRLEQHLVEKSDELLSQFNEEVKNESTNVVLSNLPVKYDENTGRMALHVVSAKSEIQNVEEGNVLVVSRTFHYNTFAKILANVLKSNDLLLVGRGSKVLGRVAKAYSTIRQVVENAWRDHGKRLYVVSNGGKIIDATSISGWSRLLEEARQNSESRATLQYVLKNNTSRVVAPLNYYLRELDDLKTAVNKVYSLICTYQYQFLPISTEEVEKISENVFQAIQKGGHGIFQYSKDQILEAVQDLKRRVDELGTEKTIKTCSIPSCERVTAGSSVICLYHQKQILADYNSKL